MKIRSLLLTALCAVAGFASAVSAAPGDVKFAPAEADLIIRIDGARIVKNQVFQKLRALPEFQKFDQDAQKELAPYDLTLDDLLKTEICVFADVNNFNAERPAIEMLSRTSKPLAKKMFALIDRKSVEKKDKTAIKSATIGGKDARVVNEEGMSIAVIALDNDLIQLSLNAAAPTALTKQGNAELCAIIDSDAMISIAYRMDAAAAKALLAKTPQDIHPFIDGLIAASVNVVDGGSEIKFRAELAYAVKEKADGVRQMFSGLLEVTKAQAAQENPELAATLKRVSISGSGNKVIASFTCDNEEAFKQLKSAF